LTRPAGELGQDPIPHLTKLLKAELGELEVVDWSTHLDLLARPPEGTVDPPLVSSVFVLARLPAALGADKRLVGHAAETTRAGEMVGAALPLPPHERRIEEYVAAKRKAGYAARTIQPPPEPAQPDPVGRAETRSGQEQPRPVG
jgi:hypothetical protein